MSNTKIDNKSQTELKSELDGVIEAINGIVSVQDLIVLVGVALPEISGIVVDDAGEYRDVVPLGEGIHILISVGDLATELNTGIHEIG